MSNILKEACVAILLWAIGIVGFILSIWSIWGLILGGVCLSILVVLLIYIRIIIYKGKEKEQQGD
jgi:hypothetical protein